MKIANIHYTGFGGLAAVVNGMVTAPGANAHDWIMGYYGVAPLDPSNREFCETQDFPYATFRPQPSRPWSAWRALAKWLRAEQPDAIICHSSTAVPPCAWYARRKRVPLIAVEHTPNEVKSRTEWAGSFASMALANRVVVLTDVYAALLQEGLGVWFRRNKIRKIPNGVDTQLFQPRTSPHPDRKLSAGMAARLAHTKRHDLLVDISIDTDVIMNFAGDGECMPSLKDRVDSSGKDLVRFNGLIPADEMPEWLRGLSLYVQASEGETFSMSVLQAMATGLPIIASDISGMDEMLGRDRNAGLLIPNTHDAWRTAMIMLANDAELCMRMGSAARARVVKKFSTSAMLDSYLNVIREINDK